MISGTDLGTELLDLGKVLGLFGADGNLDPSWFGDPLTRLQSIFSDTTQRDALLDLLDNLLPPVRIDGTAPGEKWHPLLDPNSPRGNVYLTVLSNGSLRVGAAGTFTSAQGAALPTADLQVQLPLLRGSGTTLTPVAGTPDGPLQVKLRVELGWARPAQPISLDAVSVTASLVLLPLAQASASIVVNLEKLQLEDGTPAQDTQLDPNQLGSEAVHLIIGLLREELQRLAGSLSGEAQSVAKYLVPLLGFGTNGIPPFPFAQLSQGPSALQTWLAALMQGTTPQTWLTQLAGLFGISAPVISVPTENEPWRVQLMPIGTSPGSGLTFTIATAADHATNYVNLGVEAVIVPGAATPVARIEARATVASIPLNGTASASVLPAASVVLHAPGADGATLVDSLPTIRVASVDGGFRWNGSTLQPLLELDDVTLNGTHYDRIDLTNADSVVAAASAAVQAAINAALGTTGAGHSLVALAGLVAPTGDAATPHIVTLPANPGEPSLADLVANPARAIGVLHRSVLLDSIHNWSFMLGEIASLLDFTGGVSGTGKPDDPWVVTLDSSTPFKIELAAWNQQQSGNAADPQQLRLGLRASATSSPLAFSWSTELLAFDLPASGEASVRLLAGQHARFVIQPFPSLLQAAGFSINADSFSATMDWAPGTSVSWNAGVNNVTVTLNGSSVNIASLKFPPAAGFDISNPAGTAASLGVSIPNLELLLRLLIARAASAWGGMPGFTLAGLLGIHPNLAGVQADWPTLADPAGPGSLLGDPFGALRNWLGHVAVDLSADGTPFLPRGLTWLRALLSNALPQLPTSGPPSFDLPIQGSGTYEDPWSLPLTSGSTEATEALAWLEPAGPPSNWAALLPTQATAALDFFGLLDTAGRIAPFLPVAPLRAALEDVNPSILANALGTLASHLASSDGVVPIDSQIPTGGTWTAGTTAINSAHQLQPKDPSAISQILAQVDAWAGGAASPRVVLLLGPQIPDVRKNGTAYSDHSIWQDLLASPSLHGTTDSSANFNLRLPGVDPATIDLSAVTAQVDYYTADLADAGTGNLASLTGQIGRLVTRIGQLRPGVPVTLVAHSTAGVAARAFAAAQPSLVKGLITLGTPHQGAVLPFLTDSSVADAVRFVQALLDNFGGTGATNDAIQHIIKAVDGYVPGAAGTLPIATTYPVGSFAGAGTTDTGGVQALALGGTLSGGLLDLLTQATGALATKAAGAAMPAPTHLAFGVRAALALPAAVTGVQVDANVRADAFRIKLSSAAPAPSRPPNALAVRVKLSRPDDWLVGSASSFAGANLPPVDVRVRWAEFGVDIQSDGSGGIKVTPQLDLYQASYHGPAIERVQFGDAEARALLGAVLQTIASPAPALTTPVGALVSALEALGIAVADPHVGGAVGISSDAFAALATDAASYLGPRLEAALGIAGSLVGFTGPAGGPWTLPLGSLPLEVYLSPGSWTLGLRTTPATSGTLPLGDSAALSFDANVQLPAFKAFLSASFSLGSLTLTWSESAAGAGSLVFNIQNWLANPLTLVPKPDAATLKAALNDALPRLLFSSVTSALLEGVLGPGLSVLPLDRLFSSTGSSLKGASALGNGTTLDGSKINILLKAINQVAGLPAGPGLSLPLNLQLVASGSGADHDPVTLALSTTAAIKGVLQVKLSAAFDSQLHVTPSGTLTLSLALPGSWGGVTVAFGVGPAGVSLSLTTNTNATIQILPTFSGFSALLSTATNELLSAVLNAVVGELSPIAPGSFPDLVLSVAKAVGICDASNSFAGAAAVASLKKLTRGDWTSALGLGSSAQQQVANAIVQIFNAPSSPLHNAIPGSVSLASGNQAVTWSLDLSSAGIGTGQVLVTLGWDASGPRVSVGTSALKLTDAGVLVDLTAGYASGKVAINAGLAVFLQSSLKLNLSPKLTVTLSGNNLQVSFLPLAAPGGGAIVDGPISIEVAPAIQVNFSGSPQQAVLQVAENWLLPLVGGLVVNAVKAELTSPLWPGGPISVQDALTDAGILAGGSLAVPLPKVTSMVTGLIEGLVAAAPSVTLGTVKLALVKDGNLLGLRLSGHEDLQVGSFGLSVRFGEPATWITDADHGVSVYFFQDIGGGSLQFFPKLHVIGLGLGLAGQDDAPLVNLSGFRLGGFAGYLFFDVDFNGGINFSNLGGGLELDAFGLPLGQATSGNIGGDNPVASSLLQSDNGSAGGDAQPVNPAVDIIAYKRSDPGSDGSFHILFNGNNQPFWIPVHAGFGPIYISQIGLEFTNDPCVGLLIDGTVKVDGLTAQADELTIIVPFNAIASPEHWTLDLKGLGIGFQSPGVTIAGGLLKNDGPPVEYDGMLLVQITEFGIVAVGAYSRPTDVEGQYTSLFVFAGVFIVIGLPPVIDITGLGLGVGYNRELIVPTDLNQIPSFVLVAALDDNGALANDPMGELMNIRQQIPAKRGSLWLAAGLRGNSFIIVNVTAVVYVVLDRGLEIGVIGVARMALPEDDTALVSLELALKARFSTAEGILSIQAQLTDNSWLLSPDCQLTGGFAFFMWFPQHQFVLTIGGYNPHFSKPPQFPDVPRLGYHWGLGLLTIKGESYFALTNACVMAGGRLDASYGLDGISVWFTAYVDFLVSWDPFHYDADVGVSVGATFSISVCVWLLGCISMDITVSLGASLHVLGPPLHGDATVDLAVASVTVSFGADASEMQPPNYIHDWGTFANKYLVKGDPDNLAVGVHVLMGLLPPDPAGGQPAPGSPSQPWKMGSEFSFQTETRMPVTGFQDFFSRTVSPNDVGQLDIAPMDQENVASLHVVTLQVQNPVDQSWGPAPADLNHFNIDAVQGQLSAATWRWVDLSAVPASAATVAAVLGVTIEGHSVPQGQSALIPIDQLFDYGNSRPLPFAVPIDVTVLKSFGTAADQLLALAASANSNQMIDVATKLLAGGGFFAQARQDSGLPASGLEPLAVRALSLGRSSPPVLAPITTGLTMKPVGLALPPTIKEASPVGPVVLDQPRLRAVLQGRPQPVSDAPPSFHTSVTKVAAAAGITRLAPPKFDAVAGARLERVAAPNASRSTAAALTPRTLRNVELGWSAGAAHAQALVNVQAQVLKDGVTLPAGTTHLWDLPVITPATNPTTSPGPSGMAASAQSAPASASPFAAAGNILWSVAVSGVAAVRITCLTRGGKVLSDQELVPAAPATIPVPASAAMLAVTCLGKVPTTVAGAPAGGLAAAFGRVTFGTVPQGKMPAVGWQTGNLLPQVGPSALLGRGACLILPSPRAALRARRATTQAMVRASEAMVNQPGVETWLPIGVGVVMIILDQQDPTAAANGDLAIAVDGATLSTPPLRVVGGRRRALLYDVLQRKPGVDHMVVAVASTTGWRLAGAVGLPGRAQEWAAYMHGGVPEHIVPEGPLTPDGQVTVRLTQVSGGAA